MAVKWTPEMDEALRKAMGEGLSWRQADERLGVPHRAAKHRGSRTGLHSAVQGGGQTSRICRWGHDKDVVGRHGRGCRECSRAYDAAHDAEKRAYDAAYWAVPQHKAVANVARRLRHREVSIQAKEQLIRDLTAKKEQLAREMLNRE